MLFGDGHAAIDVTAKSRNLIESGKRKDGTTVVGELQWMAPEIMEQAENYNTKADIWSLGV